MNMQPIGAPPMPDLAAQPASPREAGTALRQAQANQASGGTAATPVDPLQAVAATPKVERAEVDNAVAEVKEFVQAITQNLEFSVDDESGRTVIKIIDRQTDEVLRQIPSEEMLQIAKALGKLKGLFVQQQA